MLRLFLAATMVVVLQASCGEGSFDCCECFYMGPSCSGHLGPMKFPNGITLGACMSFCATQQTCPVDHVAVGEGCLD